MAKKTADAGIEKAKFVNEKSSATRIKLSLILPKEFTVLSYITCDDLSADCNLLETFASDIEDFASPHGGATIEQPGASHDDDELLGTTRWRIPLACYHKIFAFFEQHGNIAVEGIPEAYLKATELHFHTQEGDDPDPTTLVKKGVPEHLAAALTGYQRTGVSFVLSQGGKALIAEEMGLGKSVQSIASMTVYVAEWPLLVLSPLSARYNWKAEFLTWLGRADDRADHPALIDEQEIQVMEHGKERIRGDAKVVVCSYGVDRHPYLQETNHRGDI